MILDQFPTLPACQLLVDGYDSPSLRIAAGENWQTAGITALFDKALHEIGLLPLDPMVAAMTLICENAKAILAEVMNERQGISKIWSVLEAVSALRKIHPFDVITKTENDMYHNWPYHEARYKSLVREYAAMILAQHGSCD